MSKDIVIFFTGSVATRFLFWYGGLDIFERSSDAAFALALSLIAGAVAVGAFRQWESLQ
ncbi:hypothetical protein [Achromobacter sp.]|uniref:hypothetical protein n=1 Tax=Achromobacter sp. TaxID=134375 RepID=UPI0028AD4CAC|nr:hypothetical protein [Achromobacter sp.]